MLTFILFRIYILFQGIGTGMWDYLAKVMTRRGIKKLDKENSFFVGDAAGRPQDFRFN